MWSSKAAAEMAVGEKAKAMELVVVMTKKAVGEKAKAMELVVVKAMTKKAVGEKAKAMELVVAMTKKAVGEKAKVMELVVVKAMTKKAVGEKAKAMELVVVKAVEEQVCASKATITIQQSKEGKNTATGQKLTSSDTEIVAKRKVVHEVTICRNTVPKLLMRSYDKHSKGDDDRRPTQPPGLRGG